jgi:hypothetical protein
MEILDKSRAKAAAAARASAAATAAQPAAAKVDRVDADANRWDQGESPYLFSSGSASFYLNNSSTENSLRDVGGFMLGVGATGAGGGGLMQTLAEESSSSIAGSSMSLSSRTRTPGFTGTPGWKLPSGG